MLHVLGEGGAHLDRGVTGQAFENLDGDKALGGIQFAAGESGAQPRGQLRPALGRAQSLQILGDTSKSGGVRLKRILE
ncbi:MAG: hypothetical protein Tsb0032_00060 [Kiloniellaceae bacterium]